MRLFYFILATTFFLVLESCTDNNESELQVYDLVELSAPETVLLSSVCDDIEYIPLETGDEIIGNIMGIKHSAGRFAIQSGGSISVFGNDGKLLYVLDKQGRGPDEYFNAFVYDINGEGEILVNDMGKDRLLFYNSSGEVIKEIKNLDGTSALRLFGDDWIFLTGPTYNGTSRISQAVINLEGDTLLSVRNKFLFEPSILIIFRFECVTYTRNDKLYYHEVMDDTVYCVDKDLDIRPHVVLNTGEERFTTEKRSNASFTEPLDAIFVSNIIETGDHFFVYCNGKEYLIDKNNSETKVVKDEGLQNDIDGGMPFFPDLQVDDEYLVQVVDAFEFRLWLDSEHFNDFQDDPDKKKQFHDLAEKLTENDNPVLVRCRIK